MSIAIDVEELWFAYHDRLLRHVARHIQDRATAEDIVQDTFMFALRAIAQGKGPTEHVSGWLFRIARNRTYDVYRGWRREPEWEELDTSAVDDDAEGRRVGEQIPSAAPSAQEWAECKEIAEYLQRMLDMMAEQQQRVIYLRLEGYSNKEIAVEMGLKLNASNAVVTRAMANLRPRLQGVA